MHPNKIHYNRYIDFIYSRRFRDIPEGTAIEVHHIIPRSLGGEDLKSNFIRLTKREHFIAHMMLWKTFEGSMSRAFWMITNSPRFKNKLTNKEQLALKKSLKYCQNPKKIGRRLSGALYMESYNDMMKQLKKFRNPRLRRRIK